MRIKEIEVHFQKEDTLDKVLDEVESSFKVIDYWASTLKEGTTSRNPAQLKESIEELSGAYGDLSTVLSIAITEKTNREDAVYFKIKERIESTDKKFVDASCKRESSRFVAKYRRIRNIIQGYVNSSDKMINGVQSILKRLDTNLNRQGKGE